MPRFRHPGGHMAPKRWNGFQIHTTVPAIDWRRLRYLGRPGRVLDQNRVWTTTRNLSSGRGGAKYAATAWKVSSLTGPQ
jgi:hypothetical protein